jgi:cytoplasmic iron level regulating protein YaaA (DUF328/UPF0246 family)
MAAMSRAPIVLLPPSEGKAPGGTGPAWGSAESTYPALDEHRREVLSALGAAMAGSEAARSKLLGVKGEALAAATAANRAAPSAPTAPAIRRYTGVLYDALDAGSLPTRERRRLARQVVIFSGLWGVLAARDPIPDYKLKMGATLAPVGKLSTWWRRPVTEALSGTVGRRVVWDLLPQEHAAAWDPPEPGSAVVGAPAAVLSVRFLDEVPRPRGAERSFRTVNHWNKLLKGALVRHVLATGADEPDALVGFEHPEGYRYDRSLTEEGKGRTVVSMVRPPR